MEKDIRQRFQQAENSLLDSISLGEASLISFQSSWDSLHADYSRCLSAGELSNDTISLASAVASRVVLISSCFSDLHKTNEESMNLFLNDLGSILHDLNRVTISPSSILPTQNAQSAESSLPPFIETAYKWLLANIDNPYPSSDTKTSIAKSSGCSLNSISVWFVSARRRIGWTTICRKHFNNCRADTVDAACRALVKEDPARVLPHPVFHDFLQMKAAAHDLYASIFTKSALAGDLDAVVKDMTEADRLRLDQEKKEHAQEEKRRREEDKEMRRLQRAFERQAQKTHTTSYPSPSHSRSPSPVPTLEQSWTDESEDEGDDFTPPVLAGRKRRASTSPESTGYSQLPCADRPMKRLRSSAKIQTPSAEILSLPSPPSSSDGLDANDGVEIVAPPQPSSGSSRKRRLSDTDTHAVPKRPRGLLNGPRVHAVSDPLPRASVPLEPGIDDWFQTNFFEIPGPVENVSFDQFAPLDIEVFNGYTFPDTQINSVQQPSEQNYTLPTLVDLPLFDEHSHVPHSAPPGGLDHLDNFLNALSAIAPDNSGEAVAPSTAFNIISQPSVDLVPSNCFSWTDFLNTDQPFLSDMDQFSLPSSCDDFSQLLPEIDLSAIQLPPLLFAPQPEPPSSADCARLAKLEQLQHLREQTRLLEQDLAVSV
ncbi:homeodomain protein 1 [Suillus clintonianus]|uniref:homeodomain protein 1 n=1 Tax=Suillus clintonianus TaxID=1904413 RepID=UPI001B881D79|nr:homeodomain protein 1 [Suillus clintonianus]KAG2155591.1 homeodomain protein 1 [Suillus clintonianus]